MVCNGLSTIVADDVRVGWANAFRFALSCSRTACPTRIVTQSVCHTLPVIRKIGARFLQESLPAGEAWASEVANRMWTSKL